MDAAGWGGESAGDSSAGSGGGFARLGTGGGGVLLATLGRLTSEETREWEEPESREAVLTEREGPGDGEIEDTREGTFTSAGRGWRRRRDSYRVGSPVTVS